MARRAELFGVGLFEEALGLHPGGAAIGPSGAGEFAGAEAESVAAGGVDVKLRVDLGSF